MQETRNATSDLVRIGFFLSLLPMKSAHGWLVQRDVLEHSHPKCSVADRSLTRKRLVRRVGSKQWAPLGDVLPTPGDDVERAAQRQVDDETQAVLRADRRKNAVIGVCHVRVLLEMR